VGVKVNKGIDVSIVVPTMNEEVTALQFIRWCHEGFSKIGVIGEIIFLDISDDRTAKIAQEHGVKVVEVAKRGLGNAYGAGKGIPNGKYVIMGDADCTYDFREIGIFIEKMEQGYDLVLGNRFKGKIEKRAMPFHHQYFGSPLTSLFFKYGLGIPTGDIHCGMRAMTAELYSSLPFLETGWEYATEMIISARNYGASITEIPISFLKEPEGRISHHKRGSWTSPFKAGWGTLRVTFTYLFDRIFVLPGFLSGILSTSLNIIVAITPNLILERFRVGLLAQAMLLFIAIFGSSAFALGSISQYAYRRKNTISNILVGKKMSSKLFTVWMFLTLIEIVFSSYLIYRWASGSFENYLLSNTNYSLSSVWIAYTSIYSFASSITIVGLIGSQAKRFTEVKTLTN
jgi:glycosyltransferase involved in cell wall biosynthesis